MNGFRLMRIRGIDIKIDWTLFLIGTFISLSLAMGYYPEALPGWGAAAYITAALFSFVGLYGSVLLHELAHAVVAQKRGMKVESILLNLFGGVSSLTEEPRRPRDEFWISIVGPLTSLNLAGTFFILASLLGPSNPAVGAIGGYLMVVNFLLAVFNLLPAFPLDGGRVLRSIVWRITGDLLKATRWVATVGRAFGWGFVGLGFWFMVSGAIFDGLWMAFIGWFLMSAARASYVQTLTTGSLEGLTVGQVMARGDRALSPEMVLSEVVPAFFGMERGRALPVVENGYLLGVLNLDQVRKLNPTDWSQKRVIDVMARRGSLLAFRPEQDLQQALDQMKAKPAFYAAVIGDGGQFAGLLYLSDLPRFLEMQRMLAMVDQKQEQPDEPSTRGGDHTTPRPQPGGLDKAA